MTVPSADGREHALGEGAGSIFVHAVAPRPGPEGPVAVCGHPLGTEPPRMSGRSASATTFEGLAAIPGSPACPECADVLGLVPGEHMFDDADPVRGDGGPSRGAAWAKLSALLVAGMMAAGMAARVLIYAMRR